MPTVAQALAQALADRGVRRAFGMPGGDVLSLIAAMAEVGIEFVLVRTEASAGFMAEASWLVGGPPGVCVATMGPGATNLVSGVAGALLDRSSVVAVTGQRALSLGPAYTHMVLDIPALMAPVSLASVALRDGSELARGLAVLDQGAGPVHFELPEDVALLDSPLQAAGEAAPVDSSDKRSVVSLPEAQHPVILAGCADLSDLARDRLRALSHRLRAPVLTTYKAKGLLDEGDPWSAGAFGLSPVMDRVQQGLLEQCDLIVAFGLDPVELRPAWMPGWPTDVPFFAWTPRPLRYAGPVQQHIVGPYPVFEGSPSRWTEAGLQEHRDRLEAPLQDGPDGPAEAIRAIQRGSPADVIATLDVGSHRITASHAWRCSQPRTLLQSNGLCSMATALPYAIAARLEHPDRPVVSISGDMGLWMCLGELGVVQERGLDLVVVYLADQALSLIALKQARMGYADVGVRFKNPDPVALGAAFGGTGQRVPPAGLEDAVRAAHARGGLQLIEVPIDARAYGRQM